MPEVEVVVRTERYYDSSDADQFYFRIWGGEDIHIGLYHAPHVSIAEASRQSVAYLATHLGTVTADSRILDIGAGYGGAARYLCEQYGCRVSCLNLSETQNARNRELNRARGLAERIEVVHGNFEELPFGKQSFDFVWSQDAILHSGNRSQVFREVARVLKPGGRFVFTDPMQGEDANPKKLEPVLRRLQLASLGSFTAYQEMANAAGFRVLECVDLSGHLVRHYSRVRDELARKHAEDPKLASREYVQNMLEGLSHWVDAGRSGNLAWGAIVLEREAQN